MSCGLVRCGEGTSLGRGGDRGMTSYKICKQYANTSTCVIYENTIMKRCLLNADFLGHYSRLEQEISVCPLHC